MDTIELAFKILHNAYRRDYNVKDSEYDLCFDILTKEKADHLLEMLDRTSDETLQETDLVLPECLTEYVYEGRSLLDSHIGEPFYASKFGFPFNIMTADKFESGETIYIGRESFEDELSNVVYSYVKGTDYLDNIVLRLADTIRLLKKLNLSDDYILALSEEVTEDEFNK